jgi:hypothetical protein
LSVIDEAGNRVAATLTINLLFGAGIVADGVLLNNEMDDFSLGTEVPNAFRLRGAGANAIEPRKRPLSSMTPAFVEDERGVLIVGSPGGSRIVSQVLLAILEHLHAPRVDLRRLLAQGAGCERTHGAACYTQVGQYANCVQSERDRCGAGSERSARCRCGVVLEQEKRERRPPKDKH